MTHLRAGSPSALGPISSQTQSKQNSNAATRTARRVIASSAVSFVSAVFLLVSGSFSRSAQAQSLAPVWNQLSPVTAPPARYLHGLTYDPVHAQAVLFGGYGVSGFLNDTWLWNGTTWTQANPSSSPAARSAFGMTYDAAQGQVVLFGGRLTANSWTNDTWLWNGATWTQANPTTIPPARSNMAMVYDAAHGNDVMFGGLVNGLASNDTWIWHGTTWSQANPANSPSARYAYSMVYDAAHSQVVMFGGQDIHGNYLNETWTWDGTNWTQQSPQTSPSARDLQGMAYDAALGQVVMFGGIDSGGNYLNDTWVWNGTTWIEQVSSPTALYAREVPNATTYDAAQGQVILFGGFNSTGSSSTTFYDTWEWGTRQNFGNINVCPSGTTSPAPCSNTLTLTYSVSTATTFGTPQVVTQGTSGLDFTLASGSTCTGSVSAGSFCTVNVTFAPIAPGLRLGAVNLVDNLGNLLVSTAIYGIGQGPLAAFSPAPQTTLPTSSLNYPVGMALDGAGNRYIANYGSGNRAGFVVKVTPGGVQTTVLSSYTSAPSQNPAPIGVAVDGAGNLFIVDLYLPYAVKLAPNGVQTTLGSGLSFPIGIALDAVGDVFIGDQNNKRVVEVTPGGVQTTVPFTGLQLPWGVAVDAAGDVFVADGDQLAQPAIPSRVLEYSSGGVQTTVLSSGLSRAYDLAVDAAGDVIIADAGNSRVVGVTPGGAQFTVGSGLGFPSGVTVDGAGDVYIGDQGNQQVYEVSRSQGPSWNFGPVNVGGRSTDLGVTIQNIGNQTLTGTVGSPSNTNFGNDLINSTCTSVNEISLAPAATCVLDIYAQPTNVGALTGTVPVSDNSLNGSPSTQTIPLQVTGTGTVTSYTLTVTGVGSGTGTVTSGDGVISCSDAGGTVTGTCSSTYPANSPVTLTASAASGSIFLGWGGACASSGTSPQCDVAMSGPENVTASFGQQNFGNLNVCPVGQNTPAPCTSATTLTYNIPTTTIMGAIQVVTQGANGLDFALGSGSTCTGTISGGNSCNVNVTFTPLAAGLRLGAVKLFDNSGALVASTLIYGVGQAPLAVFSPGARVQVHTGTSLHYPNGLLADAAGNLFIADGDNQRVLKVSQNGSVTTVPASGLSLPQGMAEDGAGNLFIADNGNQVVEIPAGCTTSACQQFVPNPLGLQSELGVAVDGAGNLFVSDYLDGKVAEVPANGGPQTIVYNPTGCGNAPGCSDPVDLTTDAAGDLFIADLGLKTVAEVPPGCTTNSCVKHIGTGWNEPDDVAVDAAGDVFVADQGLGQIVEVPAGCNNSACQVVLVNGVYTVAVKVDAAGNLFFDNVTTNQVFEVTRSLPPSLSFALTNVGATSTDSPQVVTLQNVGNQPLSGTATTVAGASFSLLSTCGSGFTLIPGATCFENFGFIPQSTGYQAGSQSFSDDTMNLSQAVSLQTINLSGSGGLNGQAVGVQVPNVVGLTQAAATSSITGTGLATGTVSTAASSVIPSGSVIASNPAAGTVVNPGSAVRLLVSTGQAPPQTPNPLSLLNNLFVTGDYASAGVTLRGTGVGGKATGTITIPDSTTSPGSQGVPDGADIVDGLLYWETLENSQLPSGNTGTFLGYPITGQQIGSDIPFTDGALSGTLRVYRADVNSYFPVAANGSGVRTGSGAFTVSLPDSGGSGFPLTEGASLVVLYRVLSPNFPLKSVVIYDGSAVPAGPTSQNMLGFYDAVGGATGESTTLSYAAGSWNNIPTSVSLAAHASQYSAPLNAGTAYAAVILSMPVTNSDNDAILDAWKGGPGAADFYAGSPGYYDVKTGAWVPLPGAVHGEKDLFVQLDYMCGAVLANGSCDPTQENLFPAPDSNGNDPLAMVKNAFAADGVVLHLEIGNAVAEGICTDNTSVNPPQLCQFPNEPGVVGWKNSLEFSKIWPKNLASCAAGGDCSPRFPYGQKDSYHYVLFGHSLAIPAWNTRYQTLTAISVNNFVTTITTTDRGPQRRSDGTMNINYCPSRITISGVLGNPFLNGAYNTTSCADSQHITVATPTVPNWSYPNNTMPEPEIGLTSGTVTSISGYSDLGGSDSAVTLGLWETDPKQDMSRRANVIAGTLFHEIGHTLALSHGGLYYDNLPSYLPTFEENCKPNYQSSMNYLFQLDGVGPNGAVAYSNQTLQTLVQSSLGGVNSLTDTSSHAATFPTSSWYTPTQPSSTASQATFHCDGTPLTGDTGYRVDGSVVGTTPPTPLWSNGQNVTFDGVPPNGSIPYDPLPYSTLRGYNDAANLDLRQVGATGSEFASMAGLLSFGTSLTPLNIAPGGNVSLNAGGTVALGSGGTVTLGSGGNVTLGSGGTIALGSGGTVTLGSGGNVTLGSGGTIALGSGGTVTLGSGGNVTLGSGGTITLGSGGTVTLGSGGNVTLGSGGTIALGSGGSVTIPSTGGSYSIPNSGGTITLGSGGTITLGSGGNVTLGSGGTIAMGSGGNVTLGSGGNVTLGSGGTITLGSGGNVTLGSGGNVTLGSGGTITLGSGGNVTLGSGGNVTLGSGGTVTLGSGGNITLGSGGNVTLGSGGTVTLGSGGTIAMGSGGTITLGSGGLVVLGSGGTITLGSGGSVTIPSSGGSYTLPSGGGTITLGSSGGTVTLGSGGTVTLGSGGNITLGSGGNITLGSGGNITLGSGGVVAMGSGGNITLGSGGTVALGSGGTVALGSGGAPTELTYETANSIVRHPTSPTYTITPTGSVQVDWLAPAFGVVQTYTISRSVNGAPPVVIGSVSGVNGSAPATTFTDTNPPVGTLVYTISTTIVPDTTGSTPRQSGPSPPAVLTVNQTIVLGSLPSSVLLTSSPLTVSATAESSGVANGLLVSFSATGSCSAGSPSINTANGVSSAIVTLNGTGSCTITASQAGNSTTVATGATAYNAASPVSGTFAILPPGSTTQSQTISFGSLPNVQYGSGFSVSATSSSGQPVSFSVPAGGPCTVGATTNAASGAATGAGLCRITASAPANSTYSAALVTQSFTVYPAVLTVAANPVTISYGQQVPALTYTFGPLVNGDSLASAVSGTPVLTTTATSMSNAGTYPITVSTGSLAAANYDFLYLPGSVVVNPATTATTVMSSSPSDQSNYMQLVTFTATVVDNSPSSLGAAPTGSVTFFSNGTQIGTGTLVAAPCGTSPCPSQAAISTASLPAGADAITVSYSGDAGIGNGDGLGNYSPSSQSGSTTTGLTQTVTPVPIVTLTPALLSFGNTSVGKTSSGMTITLSNTGDSALTLGSGRFSFTGPNARDFAETDNCLSSLDYNSGSNSCAITVTFTPSDTGVETATLQITDNDDGQASAQQFVALSGSGLSTIAGTSVFTDAIFANANSCGAITLSGAASINSFNSLEGYASSKQNSGGNVGTDGNVTVSGGATIYGTAAVDALTTGKCSASSVTGLTTNGGPSVAGGLVALNGPVNYPAPSAPNPAPPTTSQSINGSCPTGMSGCSSVGSKAVSLAPGSYGNVSAGGGTIVHLSKGNYNFNSLKMDGGSLLHVDSGPVIVHLAGASLIGGNLPLDLAQGGVENPTGIPGNLQFTYGGSQGLNLAGGANAYATVYAPNALVNLTGGTDFFGSIIGSTVTSSGSTSIHYDNTLPNIQQGNTIWFTAVVNNVKGLPANQQTKLYFTNGSISFSANGVQYNLPVPNAVLTLNAASGITATTYDLNNNRWSTSVADSKLTGNTFVSGVAFPVPVAFPAGIQNVTWSASFSSDTPGVTLQWQWNAEVYTQFNQAYATAANNNVLGVNAEDGSADANGTDPAGTPESYKQDATFGATDGYFSAVSGVVPTVAQVSVSPSSLSFGNQMVGQASSALVAVLTNNYSSAFTISSITVSGANSTDFTESDNCPRTTAGLTSSCTINVTFKPGFTTSESAKIVINDNANNSPQTVYLTGTGQP